MRALQVFHVYSSFLFCLKGCNWGFQILGCCSHSIPGHTYLPRTFSVCSNTYAICSKECKYTSTKTVKKLLFETFFLQQMWLLNWKRVVMYPSILGCYSWVVNGMLHITFRLTLNYYECWQILNLLLHMCFLNLCSSWCKFKKRNVKKYGNYIHPRWLSLLFGRHKEVCTKNHFLVSVVIISDLSEISGTWSAHTSQGKVYE